MWNGEGDWVPHTVVWCSKAAMLRAEMRWHWTLPAEELLQYTGRDWLLLLLHDLKEDQRAKVLMVFWRAWHLRNGAIHGKGQGSVRDSVGFLVNYYDSLLQEGAGPEGKKDDKGKGKVAMVPITTRQNVNATADPIAKWLAPHGGRVKVNTDAGFCPMSGRASTGIVARDDAGRVLLTAWSGLGRCASPEEAEAEAYLQGVRLVAEWEGEADACRNKLLIPGAGSAGA
jgi:hypothetical protein